MHFIIFSYGVSTLPMEGHEAIIIYWQIPKLLTAHFHTKETTMRLFISKRNFLECPYYNITSHS